MLKKSLFTYSSILSVLFFISCENKKNSNDYSNTLSKLKERTSVVELFENEGPSRLIVCPELQGKIICSSYNGSKGQKNGWVAEAFYNSKKFDIKNIGGEDRLWIGPLGSQFSFYYQQIVPLSENNWKIPQDLSSGIFHVNSKTNSKISMHRSIQLTNFIGTKFKLKIERNLNILDKVEIENELSISLKPSIKYVAFESENKLTNDGQIPHLKETGLVSLWSAGMFQGTDDTFVIVPLEGNISKDSIYASMGKLTEERYRIEEDVLLFKTDGKYRSKIGVPSKFAPARYGCYSKSMNRLTLIEYTFNSTGKYSKTGPEFQKEPFIGEAIPVYNNGPMDLRMSKKSSFYELESLSSMEELKPGESINHSHKVYHFSADFKELQSLSKVLLGFDLIKLEL